MKRKSILALILILSISLVGCKGNPSNTNAVKDSTNQIAEDANDSKEKVKNTAEGVKENAEVIGDSLNYTALNFKSDVTNAGYELKDSMNSTKNYFAGNETDYLLGNDIVRVYEYNSSNDLETDIKRISDNGLTISGTEAKYTRKPYYYRKGNSLIMYEGNEPAYVGEFNTLYGNTLIP